MNPWLEISLEDYERHMALPAVAQDVYLAGALERLVRDNAPDSVAIIGCAGGNGFERLPPDKVRRVVGTDINAGYLAETRHRHADRFREFELICCDITSPACRFDPVELIYAGLIFEYIDLRAGLISLRRLVRPIGLIAIVLQLHDDAISPVTPSPYIALAKLGPYMRLILPEEVKSVAESLGFSLRSSTRSVLSTGKAFQEMLFEVRPE
jgi:hypothetical protein